MKDILKFIIFGGLFIVPFLALYVENDYFFPYITGKNFGFRIIVEVIFASWIILAFYDAQYRPKFSWIYTSFLSFLAVMFFANYFGESPTSGFWSNFERMEGYVTLVHMFAYMMVAGSVLTTQTLWSRYFNTTLIVASLLSLHAFGQVAGVIEHRYGGFRVDATLGNATYMAVYMLFHVFIAGLMLVYTKSKVLMYTYGGLMLVFAYLLIQTATRGTTVALVGGVLVAIVYALLFGKEHLYLRKIAFGVLVGVVLIIGGFISVRDSEFVTNNPTLTRIASISLEEGLNRFNIWGMAFEGVKDRPLLGWGQSNYNYVFNEHFRPELHGQEAWFDRVHNIVMDWLIAGGILGLLTYFSILFSALYYLFLRPLLRFDASFTVVERSVLLGLLAGYTVHNIFVFDNIVSYIFYGTILAYIHARVATPLPHIATKNIDTRIVDQIIAPIVAICFVGVVYVVNVPNMQAAGDVIQAFQTNDPNQMLTHFERALSRNTFAKQEIREQLTQRGQSVIMTKGVADSLKEKIALRIEEELRTQINEKPRDARVHVFISSFYRSTGQYDKAREQLAIARSLSPRKQVIIYEQGFTEIQAQQYEQALAFFKEAFELGEQFLDSRTNYAAAAIFAGKSELMEELLRTDEERNAFAGTQFALQAVYHAKMYPKLIEMLTYQVSEKPDDAQLRTSLAFVHHESGDLDGAIRVLTEAMEAIPSFKPEAEKFITGIVAEKANRK